MVAGNPSGLRTQSTDRTAEASVLQAFLLHLEDEGLVEAAGRRSETDALRANEAAGGKPAELENAVRRLISLLRKPS